MIFFQYKKYIRTFLCFLVEYKSHTTDFFHFGFCCCISVNKIELWDAGGTPKYWTVLFFTSEDISLPQKFSKVMKDGNWFVDFKSGKTKYIVFRDKILKYTIGNKEEKENVCNECRKLGITDDEMGWNE